MITTAAVIPICSADIAIRDVLFRWAEKLKPSESSEKRQDHHRWYYYDCYKI